MAIVPIVTILTKTSGGFHAEVSGIDPTDYSCLTGKIDTPALGTIKATWNDGGICRDRTDECNLNRNDTKLNDVFKIAEAIIKMLGA